MLKDWIQALNNMVKGWMKVLNSKDWTKSFTSMVKDWIEALKKGPAWLAGGSPPPDRRSKVMLAGTLAFVAVLLVGLVMLGGSTKTPRRAAAPGLSYGLGLSPLSTTTTTTTTIAPASAAPAAAKTAGKTAASSRVAHHHRGARRAAAALTATHYYTVRTTTYTRRIGRQHLHHRPSTHPHRSARVSLGRG